MTLASISNNPKDKGSAKGNKVQLQSTRWDANPSKNYFSYKIPRQQQIEIMEFIYQNFTSSHPKIAIFEAATGIGKTAAALAAALAYNSHVNKIRSNLNTQIIKPKDKIPLVKLLVLGRTHTQADRVIEELSKLKHQQIKAISIRGKQSMCINESTKHMARRGMSFTKACAKLCKSKLCKPYTNIQKKIYKEYGVDEFHKWITSQVSELVFANDILSLGKKRNLCPYELSRVLLPHVDVVACSYQYLFNSSIRSRFFNSLGITIGDCTAIIDECHGLPALARDLQQHKISHHDILRSKKELDNLVKIPKFTSNLGIRELKQMLSSLSDMIQNNSIPLEEAISPFSFFKMVEKETELVINQDTLKEMKEIVGKIEAMNSVIQEDKGKVSLDDIGQSSFERVVELLSFLLENIAKRDLLIAKKKSETTNNPGVYLKIACVDPVSVIHPVLSKIQRVVMMSGTLGNPKLLTLQLSPKLKKEARFSILRLSSPYTTQCNVFAVKGVSSKYKSRTDVMYSNYVSIIHEIISNGNYKGKNIGIFCPSYNILKQLLDKGLQENLANSSFYIINQGMSSRDSEKIIKSFKQKAGKGAILLSVLGGRSSEGADFPGKEMEVVLIIGIPYPPQSIEIKTAQEYYNSMNLPWFELVYNFPAFYSINQAAGRAIRSLNDNADIYFLDERILQKRNISKLSGWLSKALKPYNSNI